jgi:hypothetical protein
MYFFSSNSVWSFGIVLWKFMSYAKDPYPMMDKNQVLQKVTIDHYHMDAPESTPKAVAELMIACWSFQDSQRPSFRQCSQVLTSAYESLKPSPIAVSPSTSSTTSNGNRWLDASPSYVEVEMGSVSMKAEYEN